MVYQLVSLLLHPICVLLLSLQRCEPCLLEVFLRLRVYVKTVGKRHPFYAVDQFLGRASGPFLVSNCPRVYIDIIYSESAVLRSELNVQVLWCDGSVWFDSLRAGLCCREMILPVQPLVPLDAVLELEL